MWSFKAGGAELLKVMLHEHRFDPSSCRGGRNLSRIAQ